MKKTTFLLFVIPLVLIVGIGGSLIFKNGTDTPPDHPSSQSTDDRTPAMQDALDKADPNQKEAYLESLSRTEVFLSPGAHWMMPYYSQIPGQKPFDLQFREIEIRFLSATITKERKGFDPYLLDSAKTAWGVSFDENATITNGFSYYVAKVEVTNLGEGVFDFGICPAFQLFSQYSYPMKAGSGTETLKRGAYELFGYNSEELKKIGFDAPEPSDKSYYNISLQPKQSYPLVLAFLIPDAMAEKENRLFLYCDLPDSQSRQSVKDENGKIKYLTPVLIVGNENRILGEEWGGRDGGSFFPSTEASLAPLQK